MKRYLTLALTVLLLSQPLLALATVGDALKNSVNTETVTAVQNASVAVRKQAVVAVLNQAEAVLIQVETEVQNSVYASSETKADSQALIDSAQTELDTLQTQAVNAVTSDDLVAVRQASIDWLQSNKDLAKDIAIDLYIDGLNTSLNKETEVMLSAKSLVRYYQYYKLDVTTYTQLIATAESALAAAENATDRAEGSRTQADLEEATRATVQASADVAAVVKEANALYVQMTQ